MNSIIVGCRFLNSDMMPAYSTCCCCCNFNRPTAVYRCVDSSRKWELESCTVMGMTGIPRETAVMGMVHQGLNCQKISGGLTSAYSLSLHTGDSASLTTAGGLKLTPQGIPGHLVWGVKQTTGGFNAPTPRQFKHCGTYGNTAGMETTPAVTPREWI
jgi:hypothetical protein